MIIGGNLIDPLKAISSIFLIKTLEKILKINNKLIFSEHNQLNKDPKLVKHSAIELSKKTYKLTLAFIMTKEANQSNLNLFRLLILTNNNTPHS
jgi:hypothetical protein